MTDDVKPEGTHDVNIGVAEPKAPAVRKAGRPPGAKNKSTLLKEALAGDFDDMLQSKAKAIFNVVADQALEGCRQSQKMILDRVVPTVHATSDEDKNKFSGGVHITIGHLGTPNATVDIADGDYEEVPGTPEDPEHV